MKKIKSPRILLKGLLLGLLLFAVGIYLLGRWDTLGGPAKAGSILLIVLASLMVLPYLLVMVLKLVLNYWLGKLAKGFKGAAEEMLAQNKSIYGDLHTFRPATDADFEQLNSSEYAIASADFESAGFSHLGDVVDETLAQLGVLTVIRVFTNADGTTGGAFYFLPPSGVMASLSDERRRVFDLSSEFSDGTFALTSNTLESDLTTSPEQFIRTRRPATTPLADLLAAHESEKQKKLAADESVTCLTARTLDEAMASERRQQVIKNAFRRDIGYVDPAEVRRIAQKSEVDGDVVDGVVTALDEAKQQPHA